MNNVKQLTDRQQWISDAVRVCYWNADLNCARTTLYVLSMVADVQLEPQIWAATVGMHGAGRFGAQCGLVEGGLLFIGIHGVRIGLEVKRICALCHAYALAFTQQFGSLECRVLRPQGFSKEDPPHACEVLTVRALRFAIDFFEKQEDFCFSWKDECQPVNSIIKPCMQ